MKQTKILIVSHYYPPHPGGIETVAENQARRLAALDNDVTVVTSSVSKNEKNGAVDGVRIIRIPAWNFLEPKGIPFPLFSPTLVLKLMKETKRADIVHIHDAFYLSSFWAAVCARVTRTPVVMTQHVAIVPHQSRATELIQNIVYRSTGKLVFKTAKKIIILNDRVGAFLNSLKVPEKKIIWQANGVDTSLFTPPTTDQKVAIRKKYSLPEDTVMVLFVGRFVPKKGYDKVIAAADSSYLLVLAGGGLKRDDTDNVRFLGKITPFELADIYKAADIFILPSEGEGFPLSVQEAMASGLPIVMTNDPGYASYKLDAKQVTFLESTKPQHITAVLTKLSGDKQLREKMSAYSLRYTSANFSWDVIIARLTDLYSQVLSHQG